MNARKIEQYLVTVFCLRGIAPFGALDPANWFTERDVLLFPEVDEFSVGALFLEKLGKPSLQAERDARNGQWDHLPTGPVTLTPKQVRRLCWTPKA